MIFKHTFTTIYYHEYDISIRIVIFIQRSLPDLNHRADVSASVYENGVVSYVFEHD